MSRLRPGLRLLPGRYAVCRLAPDAPLAAPGPGSVLTSITRTAAETSIVCREEEAPADARVEPGWRAVEVDGPLDFDEIGILRDLADPLAAAKVPIFVVSTFDTDYVLVPDARWDAARRALTAAGFALS